MLAILLATLAHAHIASSPGSFMPVLQPYVRRSPDGKRAIEVDPSHWRGIGAAHYRASLGEEAVWAGELDFTMWEAAITDDGFVAGWGATRGIAGLAAWSGELHVAIHAPDGSLVCDLVEPIKGSYGPDGPPNPRVNGMYVQHELRRLVVRVVDQTATAGKNIESWRTYDLESGALLAAQQPATALDAFLPEPGRGSSPTWISDAIAVRGTPLTVALCGRGNEAVLVLSDEQLAPIDMLVLGRARDRWEPLPDVCSGPLESLRSVEPHRFEVLDFNTLERVTCAVKADAHGVGRIRELERVPIDELQQPPPVPLLALRELEPRPIDLTSHDLMSTKLVLDPLGRIVAIGTKPPAVVVVDLDGKQTLRAVFEPDAELRFIPRVRPAHDGALLLAELLGRDATHWRIDGCTGAASREALGGKNVVPSPTAAELWSIDSLDAKLQLFDEAGLVKRSIVRRPDRRWFADIRGAEVANDGTLFVLDQGSEREWNEPWALVRITPDITQSSVLELPLGITAGARLCDVSVSSTWVLLSDWTSTAYLLRRSDDSVQRVESTGAASDCSWILAPSGEEVWCLERKPPVVRRFELPAG